MSLRAILSPGVYHGLNKKPPFFEGWYYKLVSADEKSKVAIIPGVILGQDAHAFVQVLDGVDGTTAYLRFPVADFLADDQHFAIEIAENRFDDSQLHLALDRPECQLSGEIQLGSLNPWPVTLLSPGVMGWYAWVPQMECYHGVLSFSHALQGTLTLNEKTMDFSGGRGYIEKDWGQSFRGGVGLVTEQPFRRRGCLYHCFGGNHSLDKAHLPGIHCRLLAGWYTPSFCHV